MIRTENSRSVLLIEGKWDCLYNRTMEPVKNPKLSELLREKKEIKSGNSERLPEVMNQIAEETAEHARFLAIIQHDDDAVETHEDGTAVFRKNSEIRFPLLQTNDGRTFYPAFTDWDALKQSPYGTEDVKTMVLSFDDYWAMLENQDAGLVINPYTDDLIFSKETLRRFHETKEIRRKGVTEHMVEKDTPVKIGEAAENPKELKDALRNCAERYRDIRTMWLKLMVKDDNEKSWLLIVDHRGERRPLFDALAEAAKGHLKDGMYLDMISHSDPFGKKAADGKPFYQKKTGLFGF